MTFKEKLKTEHPELVNKEFVGGCFGCPEDYGYEEPRDGCFFEFGPSENCCRLCWNREMPEKE